MNINTQLNHIMKKCLGLVAIAMLLCISCEKEERSPLEQIQAGAPVVTDQAASVTENTVVLYGYVNPQYLLIGGECGFIISTSPSPSLNNGKKFSSNEIDLNGRYSVALTNLSSSTKYYFKSYVTSGTSYLEGEAKGFTTKSVRARVTTMSASDVSLVSATLNGSLAVEGEEELPKSVSFLFSTSEKTLEGLKANGERKYASLEENGSFSRTIESLSFNTTYYYVACAEVYDKEFYGDVKQFSTNGLLSGAVDMGLSVKWSSTNLGATKPEEYGGYYQWAGTEDVSNTSIYLWWYNCPYHTGSDEYSGWTKYNTESSYGTVDNKTTLEASDDAATVNLGGKWRMPTYAEWTELRTDCTWTWTTLNGVKGYMVTSMKNGNSIFLPAAGYRYDVHLDDVGSDGDYWSSSLTTGGPYRAYGLHFYSDRVIGLITLRYCGLSVRPVTE